MGTIGNGEPLRILCLSSELLIQIRDLRGETVSERRWRLWPAPWDRLWEVKTGCLRQGRWVPGTFLGLGLIQGEIPSSGETILILGSRSILKNWAKTPSQQWQQLAFPITSLSIPVALTSLPLGVVFALLYLFFFFCRMWVISFLPLRSVWRQPEMKDTQHFGTCRAPPTLFLPSTLTAGLLPSLLCDPGLWSLTSPTWILTGQSSSSYGKDQMK